MRIRPVRGLWQRIHLDRHVQQIPQLRMLTSQQHRQRRILGHDVADIRIKRIAIRPKTPPDPPRQLLA